MLQQMSSPPSAQVGEVATVVRSLEGRVCDDASSEAFSDIAEDFELPQCKIRRNYNCAKCTFYTQNPRTYLLHTRDVHFEKLKIFDCPFCVYASRHRQKLSRHVEMVHGGINCPESNQKVDVENSPSTGEVEEERMEDLLEEIEECDDIQLDIDDGDEIPFERAEINDMDTDRGSERSASSNLLKNKDNFFSCDKCNYVTHLKARYTKHVKYHSMPMIKCTVCEFRTPYKWNLDRHMKNHGGTGSFHCSMCNFTADIKQSLTVHEMNHHTPSTGQLSSNRRRNRVGASDTAFGETAVAQFPKEEEGSGDSRSSHSASEMGLQYPEKDMISCNSDSNDASASELRVTTHMQSDAQSQHSPNGSADESRSHKHSKRAPRPIPQLIPLNTSTPNQNKTTGEPPAKKFKESTKSIDITLEAVNNTSIKEPVARKKNESFFDKLKERLLTETGEEGSLICKNCGFESKCLSEHSVHEKNCAAQNNRPTTNSLLSSLGSTRCQNCRHRCKSSADLYHHMQTCRKTEKCDDKSVETKSQDSNEAAASYKEQDIEPHPMENVVFVWNNINQNTNKFNTPLDININDDSTLPKITRVYENETADDNENMNLSPSQAFGKNVFKCPHCQFWASTASRFHVHIVGHLNKKPFECSLCRYKSNWRWDITKHIKLKSARDPEHNEAKVLMTDETGRRNYSKYNRYLAVPILNENGETEFNYIDPSSACDPPMEVDESYNNDATDMTNTSYEMQPLNLQTQHKYNISDYRNEDIKKAKKTLWKCKKCNYKDPSKEALLEHVREHAKSDEDPKGKKLEHLPDPADLAYRCGHCNQLSNWKHVIQRHCRLKHDGIIKVITTLKPKPDPSTNMPPEMLNELCTKCPFKASDKKTLMIHMQQHQPSQLSIFKCYFCPYFVKDEQELIQHLLLHDVTDPEDYIARAMGCKWPLPEPVDIIPSPPLPSIPPTSLIAASTKRHKCTECPYETNSKSQYMYHEQFHRLPADTPYKCPECNYSVSKRHLLHQHLRVHGIVSKKHDTEADLEASVSQPNGTTDAMDCPEDIPYVWVSAKNEFHKMYKCRYCSYVNSQKCKIPNHEKIHCLVFESSDRIVYKCLECKFTYDNSAKLAEHSKNHEEIYGRIYCPVEDDVPDEEQIAKLRKVIELEKSANTDGTSTDDVSIDNDVKILHFCQKCPARYLILNELQAHDQFHNSSFTDKCSYCDFAVSDNDELTAHLLVHSDEYHTKTKMLKFIHKSHNIYKEPRLELVQCPFPTEPKWIVSQVKAPEHPEVPIKKASETKHAPKQYSCKECPAKFFKSSALTYHLGLHGGEGEYKCKKCTYAVKNVGNLAKHELLHENESKPPNRDYESGEDMDYKNVPLSGTDLFQRKTEAQKRVLTDKDKLVKPNDHFPPVLQADPQFGYLMHGNPEFIYPTYMKNGRQKEKRYKCHKCPSAFEKREQYKIHLSLHGSKQRYKCELCDYSVKYYANYVQHMRKHQMNDEAQAERKKEGNGFTESEIPENVKGEESDNIKLAIKTMPKGAPKTDFQQFSIRDQQTLRLLQRRRSLSNICNDENGTDKSPTKERKMHICVLCPYTNQRRVALYAHQKRHDETDVVTVMGNHKCSYCHLIMIQSHFFKEHLKTHFNYAKTLTPDCFVANEDVTFRISKVDEEDDHSPNSSKCGDSDNEGSSHSAIYIDLKVNTLDPNFMENEEKTFVNRETGEVLVEQETD